MRRIATLPRYCLASEAQSLILAESTSRLPCETGGILIGRVNRTCIHITHAIGPGPLALHELNGFQRDGEYSQRMLDEIVAAKRGDCDYLGEWHSHPGDSAPSPKDRRAMRYVADSPAYATPHPIMGLCLLDSSDCWHIEIYMRRGSRLHRLKPLLEP